MSILLVEDDPGIGRFVSRGLTAEGFEVEWLRSGKPAAARLQGEAFEAAVLDLGLPDIDGVELCRGLRHDGVQTPILMLTARDGLDDKLAGFRAGADDYLSKPFAFEELLARLNVLIRRGAGQTGVTEVGRLRLDGRARTAAVGDTDLALPSREFDVLACLARTPGQAVTRREILDRAWGDAAEVADNTLDVYVGYLRRRLAAVVGAPSIETVRGVGFRLVA
jgi:DNA-binding response OmpR family regulator